MRISAHQPAYLPWAGYLERINMSELFIVLDEVQFEKNSFTNRNRIKTSNGLAWLTVPVNLKGHLSNSIRDIEISNDVSWRKKHWKTIQQNYQKSLFFDHHKVFFESIYNKDWKNPGDAAMSERSITRKNVFFCKCHRTGRNLDQ